VTYRHDESPVEDQLRALAPTPPVDEVDWIALHTRITADAAPLLRRRPATWWHVLGSRSADMRRTAAAAVIAVIVAAGLLMPDRPAPVALEPELHTIEEELAASVPYASVPLLASGAEDSDVIDALLLYDAEAR
ncbi:MAG TPA: hypothetical protein VHG09_10630, partial [Longimicrobiales bacterium]|nr:hypothetical protein [Longimicrobiales bacterium]